MKCLKHVNLMSTTSAASTATSVPLPIAIPAIIQFLDFKKGCQKPGFFLAKPNPQVSLVKKILLKNLTQVFNCKIYLNF